MDAQNLRRSSLNHLGQLPKNRKKKIFGTPGVAPFLNFLSAVATVGSENFTQQSSNIPLMNPLSIPELSLNHLEQLQKKSKNQVWAPHFGGTFGPSGPTGRGLTRPNS